MRVRHAKEIARRWVSETASSIPGFAGAFFHGSANWLPDEAALPATSDLDIMVVLDAPDPPIKPGKFGYQGVLLEVSYLPGEPTGLAGAGPGPVRSGRQFPGTGCHPRSVGTIDKAPGAGRQRVRQRRVGFPAVRRCQE
jgi:hypothetical protein